MTLRIITVEEHISDPDLIPPSNALVPIYAPYIPDLAADYAAKPDSASGHPELNPPQIALKLLSENVQSRIAEMDAAGIDTQILSYSHPALAVTVELASAANDRLAEVVRSHPTRFGGFCTLPWGDPQAAVAELERCVLMLGLVGTMLIGRPQADIFVDDERFWPILEAHSRLKVPLYLHPGTPIPAVQHSYYSGFNRETTARLSMYAWGWHNEAGIQAIRLILSGALDVFPELQIISGHWGEMVPFFLQRLDDMLPPPVTGLMRTISQTYREHFFVSPSGMLHAPNFRFCRELLGSDRILYAVDYPYLTMTGARRWLEQLDISETERIAIASGNISRIFKSRQSQP